MFRIHDNVPEIYIQESRDFLLISRLFDTLISGVKYDIDTIVNILDSTKARDTVLSLLCTKIGFFPTVYIDAEVLKYIIASFPYIVRNKGTETGIRYAVNAILKSERTTKENYNYRVVITHKNGTELHSPYTIEVLTRIKLKNVRALEELLKYVVPTGYKYSVRLYVELFDKPLHINLKHEDLISVNKTRPSTISTVYTNNAENRILKEYQATVGFAEVVAEDDNDTLNVEQIYPSDV